MVKFGSLRSAVTVQRLPAAAPSDAKWKALLAGQGCGCQLLRATGNQPGGGEAEGGSGRGGKGRAGAGGHRRSFEIEDRRCSGLCTDQREFGSVGQPMDSGLEAIQSAMGGDAGMNRRPTKLLDGGHSPLDGSPPHLVPSRPPTRKDSTPGTAGAPPTGPRTKTCSHLLACVRRPRQRSISQGSTATLLRLTKSRIIAVCRRPDDANYPVKAH
jgi:hypothetical protein